MARLPTPGADNNAWGDVLNDFLLQSHTTGGTLKNNAVGTAQVQDDAITEAKLASAVRTKLNATPPASNPVVTNAASLRSLLIFYAAPNIMNAKYSNDYAAGVMARYDDVVLGAGLQDPGHADFTNTSAIIDKTQTLNSDTVIWGYIDCGVTTGNFSLAQLQTHIDQWIAIGAQGIFCDVIGYAYGVSRARQNSIIDYIHSKGVGAILNVFNPDEIFSPAVDVLYNPTGVATHANDTDVYLLESWVCNSDAYSSPYYATISDVKTRGDAARAYRASLGVRIFTVSIIEHDSRTDNQIDEYRGMVEGLARVWRLDGSGLAASNYSATGVDVGTVRPRFSLMQPLPLRPTAPYILNGPWTEVEAPDLGLTVHYENGTRTWLQQ